MHIVLFDALMLCYRKSIITYGQNKQKEKKANSPFRVIRWKNISFYTN